jgi:hypothetical protein
VLKGSGSIAGDGRAYDYVLAFADGAFTSGDQDRIRLKIVRHNNGSVTYDTQPGAADNADPTTVVASGSNILLIYSGASVLAAPNDPAGAGAVRARARAAEPVTRSRDAALRAAAGGAGVAACVRRDRAVRRDARERQPAGRHTTPCR